MGNAPFTVTFRQEHREARRSGHRLPVLHSCKVIKPGNQDRVVAKHDGSPFADNVCVSAGRTEVSGDRLRSFGDDRAYGAEQDRVGRVKFYQSAAVVGAAGCRPPERRRHRAIRCLNGKKTSTASHTGRRQAASARSRGILHRPGHEHPVYAHGISEKAGADIQAVSRDAGEHEQADTANHGDGLKQAGGGWDRGNGMREKSWNRSHRVLQISSAITLHGIRSRRFDMDQKTQGG